MNKENNIEIYSDEDVISKLNLEITKLCKMLDVHTNFDQYKMIINNLRNTIEARRDVIRFPNTNIDELNKDAN
jgi:3-polyprenyl-4-hydroxybenzoate decarboxylase